MNIKFIRDNKITIIFGLFLQALIFFSAIQSELFTIGYSKLRFIFFLINEILIFLSLYLIYKKIFSIGIFIYLILFLNFILTPISGQDNNYITLPKNMSRNVFIKTDLISGISSPSHISTDQMGFRTTKNINYFDKKNEYRIFAIGASTTEQIFIDDSKTWATYLQSELNILNKNVVVINTGVSGLRAKHHFYTALEVSRYSPDALIFMFGINDWNKDITSNLDDASVIRINFEITSSPLFKSLNVIRTLIDGMTSENSSSKINEYGEYYAKQNNSLDRNLKKSIDIKSVSKDYEYWVNKIFELCEEKKLKCLFVNQATAYSKNISFDLKKRLWMTPPERNYTLELDNLISVSSIYNSWLMKTAFSKNFPICDISEQLDASLDNFYDDCHFNEGGAKKVGKLLSICIRPILQQSH